MRIIYHIDMIFETEPRTFSQLSPERGVTPMDPTDPRAREEPVPLMQRLFDNVWLLLIAGIVVMFVVYTGWGMWEILTIPAGTLP